MCDSLSVAHKVLKLVHLPDKVKTTDVWVEAFDNCREQGYVIKYNAFALPRHTHSTSIFFAKHRSGDDIVVYVDFAPSGNKPNEAGWKHRTFFRPDGALQAARYIEDTLTGAAKTFERKVRAAASVIA
jgi:hypothetical protein